MNEKIFIGQVIEIILDCGVELADATAPAIAVKKPDGSTTSWSAQVSNGQYLTYTTTGTDLDQAGDYVLQAVPGLPSGYARGAAAGFTVKSNFQP